MGAHVAGVLRRAARPPKAARIETDSRGTRASGAPERIDELALRIL